MTKWYVWEEGGDPVGPVTEDLLRRGVLAGKVPVTSSVCLAGADKWQPLAAVPTFADAVRKVAPPPDSVIPPPPRVPSKRPRAAWYVRFADEPAVGPFDQDQIVEELRAGRIPSSASICKVGEREWRALADEPTLAPAALPYAPVAAQTSHSGRGKLPPPLPSTDAWFVLFDDGSHGGPLSTTEIRGGLLSGKIPLTARVARNESGPWTNLKRVFEFAEACRSASSPTTPARPQERIFFDNGVVKVTGTHLEVGATTYPLTGLTAVSVTQVPRDFRLAGVVAAVAIAVAVVGVGNRVHPTDGLYLTGGGVLLLLVAFGLALFAPQRWAVGVATAGGQKNAFVSRDRGHIEQIVAALKDAIAARG